MFAEIGNCLQTNLDCLGVGVIVEGEHHCMSSRGVKKTRFHHENHAFHWCFPK